MLRKICFFFVLRLVFFFIFAVFYLDIASFRLGRNASGFCRSFDLNSSGCSVKRVGTGPLSPAAPSKTGVAMSQRATTTTAALSSTSCWRTSIVGSGSGRTCSWSSMLPALVAATAQRYELLLPFELWSRFISFSSRFCRSSVPPISSTAMLWRSILKILKNLLEYVYVSYVFYCDLFHISL